MKFYVCPESGTVKTEFEIAGAGEHDKKCDCRSSGLYWDDETQDFETCPNSYYIEYVEIPEEVYEKLKKITNQKKRIDAIRSVGFLNAFIWKDETKKEKNMKKYQRRFESE
jgi:hypothetical protein